MKSLVIPLSILLVMAIAYITHQRIYPARFTSSDFTILWEAAQSCRTSANGLTRKNEDTSKRILKEVVDMGNPEPALVFLEKARRINQLAEKLSEHIRLIDTTRLLRSGGMEPTMNLPKQAYQPIRLDPASMNLIRIQLDAFADSCSKLANAPQKKMTVDEQGKPLGEHSFYAAYFDDTPLVIGLYSLRRMEVELRSMQSQALGMLHQQLVGTQLTASLLIPVVKVESDVVTEGEKYRASLSVAHAFDLSSVAFRYQTSEGEIKANQQGIAQLSFVAKANHFDRQGLAKKAVTVALTFPLPFWPYRDTTFRIEEEYVVRKK